MQKILERKKFSQKVEKTITPDDTTIEEQMIFIEERIKRNTHGCTFDSFLSRLPKVKLSLLLWLC